MAEIILMAETGSDITPEVAAQWGIQLVPMHVSFKDETRDDGTFPAKEVVDSYKRTGFLPKTSGSTPGDFTPLFEQIHAEKPDARILHMAYSAVTTCSCQSCEIASEGLDYVTIMDTKQVSVGQYVAVTQMAARLREHPEWTVEEAREKAVEISQSVRMAFVPDTLEFLRAGGRVSNAAAIAGGLLKLHPCIEILDGYLKATKKYRGKMEKVAAQLVKEYITEQGLKRDHIWLINSPYLADEVRQAAEQACRELGVGEITWVTTGCVITCHGGPGAFGVVGLV